MNVNVTPLIVRPIAVRFDGETYISARDALQIARRTRLAVSTVVRVLTAQVDVR